MSTEDPRAAALKFHRDRRDKLDWLIRDGAESPHPGVRQASEDLKVERDHLVALLGAIGEQDLRMYAAGIAEGRKRAAAAIRALIEPKEGTYRSHDVLAAYAVAAEIAEQSGGTNGRD